MSENDPHLQDLEDEIKALDDRTRVEFLSRQLAHATINYGPETLRKAADQATAAIDDWTSGTDFEALGDRAESWLQRFKDTRAAHWLGKGPVLAALATAVVLICIVVGGVLLGVWDAP